MKLTNIIPKAGKVMFRTIAAVISMIITCDNSHITCDSQTTIN